MKLALWLLNSVSEPGWDREGMLRALARGGVNEVRLGEREGCEPGILMREAATDDEYFVPIPVKCLGDPRTLHQPSGLAPILEFYDATYFGANAAFPWDSYWRSFKARKRTHKVDHFFRDVCMVGPRGEGYYRAMQKFSARYPGFRHVLVGYSQGGLVARYLAFLDERLFGNELVHGVVTLDSPNFGSPLARPENADNVAQALALVVAGVAQLDAGVFPEVATQLRALALAPQEVDIGWTLRLLDAALARFVASKSLAHNQAALERFMVTARKWLSGLEGAGPNPVFAHEESAFYDLDVGHLAHPGSVLHDVNTYPLQRIKHAAIVGSDNHLDSLVLSGLQTYVSAQGFLWGLGFWLLKRRLAAALRGLLSIAGEAYKAAMIEQALPQAVTPAIAARVTDLTNGVQPSDPRYDIQTDEGIPPLAHDFAIPAAYQLIERGGDACLGNWLNPEASHLSGANPRLAGKTSQKYLLEILRKMAPAQ